MEIVAYKIDTYGYVWNGCCFKNMNDIILYVEKYWGEVKSATFVEPDYRTITYWLNNWKLEEI